MSEKRTCSKGTFGCIVYLFVYIERTKDFIAYSDQIQLYFFFIVLFSCKFKPCCLDTFRAHLLICMLSWGLWNFGTMEAAHDAEGSCSFTCKQCASPEGSKAQTSAISWPMFYFGCLPISYLSADDNLRVTGQEGKLLLLVSHKLK